LKPLQPWWIPEKVQESWICCRSNIHPAGTIVNERMDGDRATMGRRLKLFNHQMGLIVEPERAAISPGHSVEDLVALIERVKQGDPGAYEPIVRRFQDMAVGYGYAILGDVQLAEDAAQEAFITELS
jgi:hypothetical protein